MVPTWKTHSMPGIDYLINGKQWGISEVSVYTVPVHKTARLCMYKDYTVYSINHALHDSFGPLYMQYYISLHSIIGCHILSLHRGEVWLQAVVYKRSNVQIQSCYRSWPNSSIINYKDPASENIPKMKVVVSISALISLVLLFEGSPKCVDAGPLEENGEPLVEKLNNGEVAVRSSNRERRQAEWVHPLHI